MFLLPTASLFPGFFLCFWCIFSCLSSVVSTSEVIAWNLLWNVLLCVDFDVKLYLLIDWHYECVKDIKMLLSNGPGRPGHQATTVIYIFTAVS